MPVQVLEHELIGNVYARAERHGTEVIHAHKRIIAKVPSAPRHTRATEGDLIPAQSYNYDNLAHIDADIDAKITVKVNSLV